jgi:hypothetical protein
MQTLRHTAAFEKAAKALSEEELTTALETIARDPECGDLIPGTGGVRKLRVAASGRGKRGGGRMIYFFFDKHNPIYLLYAYAKNRESTLSAAQRNALGKVVASIKSEMRQRRR